MKRKRGIFVAIKREAPDWVVCVWHDAAHDSSPADAIPCRTWWDAEKTACEIAKREGLPLVETWTSRSALDLERYVA